MSKKERDRQQTEQKASLPNSLPAAPHSLLVSPWGRMVVGSIGIVTVVLVVAVSVVALRDSMKATPDVGAKTNAAAAPLDAPLKDFKVVNAHEHLFSLKYLDKYLQAAEQTGVSKTVFLASSEFTLMGSGHDKTKGNEENTKQIIEAARLHPGKIVPFCTLHPDDADKVEKLKGYVAAGVKGLKLYTGHTNFYDRPLDAEEMQPVYAYCAETGLPICWHVSYTNYAAEFERVLARYPNLKVIIPHLGVTFFRPRDPGFAKFEALLDKYPNLYTDTSFGTRGILVDGIEVVSKNPEIFKAFFKKYSDRILFGTDMVVTGNKEKTAEWIAAMLRVCRNMLEKDRYKFVMEADWSKRPNNPQGIYRGLGLSDDILRKIYETNFDRLFPQK